MSERLAKPFLKWAGGKTQLINQIQSALPPDFKTKHFAYIEPFVGSGAVLFWMLNNFPGMKKAVINDVNADLINTYKIIASRADELIVALEAFQKEYYKLEENELKKEKYYYSKRELFNSGSCDKLEQAALFIFLNRTCFNGLYRVNRKSEFNVPMGRYKRPTICDRENILSVSKALQRVEILCGDYEETLPLADTGTLFYFDPPYKPLTITSSFNSYAHADFDDKEQIRLRNFCVKLDRLNHHWILSNSDVRNVDDSDNFFDDLYADFTIYRVDASRRINSKSEKRGILKELLITNR
jgi:DNA adenine methylase